jgi:response regulator NasT
MEFADNAAGARRRILERYYTILVINSPLADESGVELAMDAAIQYSISVLLIVPGNTYTQALERVTDYGILVIDKPFPVSRIGHSMRFLSAHQDRLKKLERQVQAAEDKVQELRLIDKAKFLLVEREHMTENEAHRYIGKQAMNNGVSRKRIAQQLLDDE